MDCSGSTKMRPRSASSASRSHKRPDTWGGGTSNAEASVMTLVGAVTATTVMISAVRQSTSQVKAVAIIIIGFIFLLDLHISPSTPHFYNGLQSIGSALGFELPLTPLPWLPTQASYPDLPYSSQTSAASLSSSLPASLPYSAYSSSPSHPSVSIPSSPSSPSSSSSSSHSSSSSIHTMYDSLFVAPLRTKGRYIVDATGARFKFSSVNWYGASDELFVAGGLDVRHRTEIATLIRALGFNSVRMPYSDELILDNPVIAPALLAANSDLVGMRAIDVLVATVEALTDAGLAVILNDHITQAGWCDGKNLCDAGWSNTHLGPFCRIRQSEDSWIANWETLMRRFVDNPRVVGADLRNEPRGLWGTTSWSSWAAASTRAGDRLLALQPDWLIIVEGLGSANDLTGARGSPIVLSVPNRLVYSVHVFAWSGWGSFAPYSSRPYPGFVMAMYRNWGYLLESDTAPVWIAEMGASKRPGKGEKHYWANLVRYLETVDADFGYWAINPRKPHENEQEHWALVDDDWSTVLDDYRLEGMRRLMKTKPMLELGDEKARTVYTDVRVTISTDE